VCRWYIPVNVVVAATVGCTIGYIVALLIRPPPRFFNFTVVMIGIGDCSCRSVSAWFSI
jgi:hypothetical protein